MSNYYVSKLTGNDTTGNGLSPATAWASIGKAIGSSPAITLSGTGDTLYIAPGLYRENVVLGLSPTGGGRLTIQGDPTGAAFGVAPGVVDWRAWTDDLTATPGGCLSATSKGFVTLAGVSMIGGTTSGSCVGMTTCTDWTVRDCNMLPHYQNGCGICLFATVAAGTALNLTVDRCSLTANVANNGAIQIQPVFATEWNMNVAVTNCRFTGSGYGLYLLANGGSGTTAGGGVAIQNCSFLGLARAVDWGSTRPAVVATYPLTIHGCLIMGGGLFAGPSAAVTEDGNVILCQTPRTNVTAGANSVVAMCPAIDMGDGRLTGLPLRPFGEPKAGSPMIAFGNYGTAPAVDFYNQARPATASAGALEIETLPGGTTYIFQVEG